MNAALYRLPTDHISSYLEYNGWKLVNQNDRCYVFEGYEDVDDNPFEIVLPINESAPDYPIYVEHTVRILSALADKSPVIIANEMILFDRDLLTIDVNARSVDFAAMLVPRIKSLIGYSANSERNLKPFFNQYYGAAKSMLNHFEISHTHNGSANYRVESQVGDIEPYQRVIFKDAPDPGKKLPLERRVMERIATGLITLENAARRRDVQPLIDGYADGFNANMCDAVRTMLAQSSEPIQYSVKWAGSLPAVEGVKIVKNIQIERRHTEYLKRASDKLRELKPELRTIKGLVIGLSSLIDPHSDGAGERSIVVQWDRGRGTPRNLRINLAKKDYLNAIKAHKDWATISVDGIALKRRSGWELAEPQEFRILR